MPSEAQYQRTLQEKRDLEKELELLNNATDANESAERIRNYIANTKEGLTDPDTTWLTPVGFGCCIIL